MHAYPYNICLGGVFFPERLREGTMENHIGLAEIFIYFLPSYLERAYSIPVLV